MESDEQPEDEPKQDDRAMDVPSNVPGQSFQKERDGTPEDRKKCQQNKSSEHEDNFDTDKAFGNVFAPY